MAIQTRREGDAVVVSPSGRLDAVTAPQYKTTVQELIEGGATRVVLDLEKVNYVSSAGIAEILGTVKLLNERDGRFCIANACVNVVSVFQMCGVGSFFQVHPSVSEALIALA